MNEMFAGLAEEAARLLRVIHGTRFLSDALPLGPLALPTAIRRGLSARTLHAMYAAAHPRRLAIVDAHRALTYRDADEEINRVANALRHRLGDGRRSLAIALENRTEYVVLWFAAIRVGLRVVHAGGHVTAEELAHMAKRADVGLVVASEATLDAARKLAAADASVKVVVTEPAKPAGGELSYEALRADGSPTFPEPSRHRGESVVFTSGTTGAPKAAARDFAVFGPLELARVLERLSLRFGDKHLVVAPLHHIAPQGLSLIHSAIAGTLYLEPRFDAKRTLEMLSKERVNSLFLVPTTLKRILELPPELHRKNPTPELRALICGSAEFGEDLRHAAIRRFGATSVFDFYGATELGWVTLIRGDEMLARPASVGRSIGGQTIAILGKDGEELPPGEVGLIGVRNEQGMLGYLGDSRATDETKKAGYTTVEDLGRLDADGYLYLAGRARDLVISGGVNVYPAEVERVLEEDPAIEEVAVIGVPDREWGEALVAVVVPSGPGFDPEAARARAKRRLSPAKVPHRFEVVDALPRSAYGKLLKKELRARYAPSP